MHLNFILSLKSVDKAILIETNFLSDSQLAQKTCLVSVSRPTLQGENECREKGATSVKLSNSLNKILAIKHGITVGFSSFQ